MRRTTGGSEFGATSTRSRSILSAVSIASRMCFIPSCSPLAEIKRTERARIWPLILGSSSVATVHHSSQKRNFGAVCPSDDELRLGVEQTRTPNYDNDYTPPAPPLSIRARA